MSQNTDEPFSETNSPPLEGCPQGGVVRNGKRNNGEGAKKNSQNYFSLPYNPKLKARAKALRKAGNLAEVLFWQEVHKRKFKGYDFDRQKVIGNYIVDFYCVNCQVVIEIDGDSHNDKQEYDAKRDAFLQSLGLTVIHITAKDVLQNLGSVMGGLYEHPAFITSSSTTPPSTTPP